MGGLGGQAPRKWFTLRVGSRYLSLALPLLLLSACVHYTPAIALDESPKTVAVTVEMRPFQDASPIEDTESGTTVGRGLSVTHPDVLTGSLPDLIAGAVLDDFRRNAVFATIRKHPDKPDFLLSGTIHRFYERYRLPGWSAIPPLGFLAALFGAKLDRFTGEADLELTLTDPAGTLTRRYRGTSAFDVEQGWYDGYTERGVRLNQAFTEAVRQIRDQILRDRVPLEATAGTLARKEPTAP